MFSMPLSGVGSESRQLSNKPPPVYDINERSIGEAKLNHTDCTLLLFHATVLHHCVMGVKLARKIKLRVYPFSFEMSDSDYII